MFFTQEDYKKIQQWLTSNSVKDTEFNEANIPFNGEETITIVQGNQNKKVFLKDLIAQVFNLGISDFVNITDKYDAPNISLEEAIRFIPSRARKEGQVITFLDKEDHWHIYQFKGALNQWNVLDTWEDLFDWEKLIIDSILPDEEDLTKSLPDVNGNSYLSLKDREYNPEDFSGLGRVILRKNIVEIEDPIYGKVRKNVLYQDMINKENTIYEIRYDFDLNNYEIEIPENCMLQFKGGSLRNGTITFNNTYIDGKKEVLINILTEGKLKNNQLNLSIFNINNSDYSNCIQTLVNSCNKVVLDIDNIQVKEVEINKSIEIDGFNNTIKLIPINGEKSNYYNVFYSTVSDIDICIKNIGIIGSFEDNINRKSDYNKSIIHFENSKNIKIENCIFKGIISKQIKSGLYGNIISTKDSYNTEIKNSYFENNGGYENVCLINVNNKKETTFIISNNIFKDYNNGFSVFNCWAGNKGNVVFENNKLINCFYYGSLLNIYGKTLHILNNTIIDCMSSSVFDFTEDGTWVSRNIIFKNNTIKLLEEAEVYNYSTLSKQTLSGGIGLKIEAENFEISNNIIEAQICMQILHTIKYFGNDSGLYYSGDFSPNKICNIYNNVLNYSKFKNIKNINTFASGIYTGISNPLLSNTIMNINIHDNNFYSGYSLQDKNEKNFRQLPIFIYSAKNIRINNNVFEDCIGKNRTDYGNLIEIQEYIYDKEYTDEKLVRLYQINTLEINNNTINLYNKLEKYYLIYFFSRNLSRYSPNFVNILNTNICNNITDTPILLLQGTYTNWFKCVLGSLTIKNNNNLFNSILLISYPNVFNVDTDILINKLPFIKRGQFYNNDYLALSNGIISYNKSEAGSLEQFDILKCDNGYFMALTSGEILDTNLPKCVNIGSDIVIKDGMYFLYLGKDSAHLLPINFNDIVSSYSSSVKEPKKTIRGALKYDTDSRQVYIDLSTISLSQQLNYEGRTIGLTKGDTGSRPNNLTSSYDVGYKYFDSTLNKPIWWTGSKWVDATGAEV